MSRRPSTGNGNGGSARALFLCLAIIFAAAPAAGQAGRERESGRARSVLPDTSRARPARTDTASAGRRDSSAAPDTTGAMSTPSLVGTLDRYAGPEGIRTKEDLHWLDYRYLGGILESYPGVMLRDQESEGQYTGATIDGMDWRAVAVSSNGRPRNDPASGTFNLYRFTTEYADRIEVVSGPRAFLYGLNSTGGAVNLVTKNYNSNRPFTKFNYSEGAYGYSNVDGTFSQNISRRTNITVGFQHQTTDGRFTGEADDAWNSREKIRYNISGDLNLIFSHEMTSAQTGLNGGVDVTRSGGALAFDNVRAVMREDSTYEKVTAHDLDLALVGTFLGDTANVSNLTFYYSRAKREFREDEDPYHVYPPRVSSDQISSWMGAAATQDFATAFQRMSAGGSVELRQIEGSPNLGRRRDVIGALWAREEIDFGQTLTASLYGRFDRYLGKDYEGFGADATLRPGGGISLFGGGSISRRVPNYQELSWTDSTVVRSGPITAERHRMIEAGAAWTDPEAGTVRIALFQRTVTDPITFSPYLGTAGRFPGVAIANGPTVNTSGVTAHFAVRFFWLSLEGNVEYLLQRSGGLTLWTFPKFSGNGGVYFWRKVLNGHLELKTGFRGRFAGPYTGVVFNPEMIAYVSGTGPPLGTSASGDFFLIGHLGDAYIHFIWENLANIRYYGTPYYPGGERAIRFGISWEFLN